ncbi:hypothetical protein Gotri_005284 [Gossypium trilobum]|uniref:Uncharacterized protein n=1 Tax=Gossypium trilobum TaxID=34281 RepID=A0A7J9EW12_9ROSI|nr:hypothetical protein [Gossypium trilobum]
MGLFIHWWGCGQRFWVRCNRRCGSRS